MNFFESLGTEFIFRLGQLTWLDAIDILLVTISFYLLFALLRRSQAALLLRGLLALALVLLLTTLLLPLPTFDLIIWIGIVAILIITPVTLQPELRRMLERIGQRIGWRFKGQQDLAETIIPPLLRAVENMSATQTGALIVLEGSTSLQEIERTGIRVDSRVTAEILQTIFFDKTPLHDGAVLIRGARVVTAGCVLPLSDRMLPARRRLGTRHRAAVGMSEQSDALVVVVSEETGTISLARDGHLERGVDSNMLRQALIDFYTHTEIDGALDSSRGFFSWSPQWPGMRRFAANLAYLGLSFLLALVAANVVRAQADPTTTGTIENVPLRVSDLPTNTTLVTPLPDSVSVTFQTVESELPLLTTDSFNATVSLADVGDEPTRVPVEVSTTSDKVLIQGWTPSELNVEAAPIISVTLPITVRMQELEGLSAAYEVRGVPIVNPDEATVTGPAPIVEQVASVEATISMANATTTVREIRPLRALDAENNALTNVIVQPEQTEVRVVVTRRINARDVGIRVVTTNSPPEGYWLSGLTVTPAGVTVRGEPAQIAAMESFVNTTEVDLSEASGELRLDVPLVLPDGVQAVDSNGNQVNNVFVVAQVAARTGDLLVRRPVQIINDFDGLVETVQPVEVEVLLNGPLPTLNEIADNPDLVRITIDASALEAGTTTEIEPQVIKPEGITAQRVETLVRVTTVAPTTTAVP